MSSVRTPNARSARATTRSPMSNDGPSASGSCSGGDRKAAGVDEQRPAVGQRRRSVASPWPTSRNTTRSVPGRGRPWTPIARRSRDGPSRRSAAERAPQRRAARPARRAGQRERERRRSRRRAATTPGGDDVARQPGREVDEPRGVDEAGGREVHDIASARATARRQRPRAPSETSEPPGRPSSAESPRKLSSRPARDAREERGARSARARSRRQTVAASSAGRAPTTTRGDRPPRRAAHRRRGHAGSRMPSVAPNDRMKPGSKHGDRRRRERRAPRRPPAR